MLNAVPPHMSLPERAAQDIRRAIEAAAYPEGRLPAEGVLAQQLGVSKATVRHAVSILEQEGLLSRRQGAGTFVVGRALGLHNNLTVNFGVTDLIESSGFVAGTLDLSALIESPDARIQQALNVTARARVVMLRRTRTADDRVVARTTDAVDLRLFTERGISDVQAVELVRSSESLYKALATIGVAVRDGVAELGPATADAALARQLSVRRGALLLRLDQTDYDITGAPIVQSVEFFIADAFKFQVFRKGRAMERRSADTP
jgi:GntR family transcriptional regulator